jgi:hypothetical protein
METQQMAMPAEMATQGPNPEEMAIYDQMRQQISPQEFSNEMLASASQVDPQAVAEFTEELRSLDVSPEELDALNDLVDQILAAPEQYDQLRQQFLAQGMPDDILPEQFDPYFFAALNMAVDQMIAAPTGVQAFAQGGIAELKPIAKAIASYGRNGDTMLAHITPAEARMLKRRGGSGTINPATGLPEFFLKKAFKKIGKAVKKFASSTVGRIVTTVALGFFLGPAAANFMGIANAAGVAAVSGFVGSAGSTLLAGGNLKDALKAGAIGGVTAGVTSGVTGGFDAAYTGPTTVGGQVDAFKGMLPGGTPTAPTAPTGPAPTDLAQAPGGAPVDPLGDFIQQNDAARAAANVPAGGQPSLVDQAKDFYSKNISPSGIREAATPGAQKAAANAVAAAEKTIPASITGEARNAMLKTTYDNALKAAMPGIMGTYGPAVGAGLGIMALTGGFKADSGQGITAEDRKGPTERIREEGSQKQYFVQGLPGVKYDQFGEPVYGESTPFTTRDPYFSNSSNFALPNTIGGVQGVAPPMAVYNTPTGAMGSRQVAQPYNNANMYSNLMAPQRYADGGDVQSATDFYNKLVQDQYARIGRTGFGDQTSQIDIPGFNHFVSELQTGKVRPEQFSGYFDTAVQNYMREKPDDRYTQYVQQFQQGQQPTSARAEVARQKQMRRAAGSGNMYANINAGLSALAPEANPMDAADTTFGARNRQAQLANLQQTYGPMLQNQRNAMNQQSAALGQPAPPPGQLPGMGNFDPFYQQRMALDAQVTARNSQGQKATPEQMAEMRRLSELSENDPGVNARRDALNKEAMERGIFYTQGAGTPGMTPGQIANTPGMGMAGIGMNFPGLDGTRIPGEGPGLFGNTTGIASLAEGGYPRRNGQISGPGTEKSDSIPAMLSDGEFVMTAKAVRGAGKGSRRAGAKQMYKLMHQLEKNAERG